MGTYSKIAQLRDAEAFCRYLEEGGMDLPCDQQILRGEEGSPLAEPLQIADVLLGNRWCIHPMEG